MQKINQIKSSLLAFKIPKFYFTRTFLNDKLEYFDAPEDLNNKIFQVAGLLTNSNHTIILTGAGISTSAGIPDYRSGLNTTLETGPGKWVKEAHNLQTISPITQVNKAIPTKSHMAIKKLIDEDLIKYLISQNTDGLHLKSGINNEKLIELHGNVFLEKCIKCGTKYLRDYKVKQAWVKLDHRTGRLCDDRACLGELYDTLVFFGEKLSKEDINKSLTLASRSDLIICLGSSLMGNPSALIPMAVVNNGGKLVVVNLQKTNLNEIADIVVHSRIDIFFEKLMDYLGYEIHNWELKRIVRIYYSNGVIYIETLDFDKRPFSYLKSVGLQIGLNRIVLTDEPFMMSLPGLSNENIKIEFEFQKFYDESNCVINLTYKELVMGIEMSMEYSLIEKLWKINKKLIPKTV
jgi:NAD-dependent SIR2 family protein deacetylase